MRKLGTIFVTIILTLTVTLIGVGHFLLSEGIVTIQRRGEAHQKVVIVDGQVTEAYNWSDLIGYTVSIDVKDSADINIK